MSVKEKLLASAQKSIAKGQLSRAIKDYRQLVECDPKDIRHRQKLAELYSRTQMRSEALEAFEAVARHYSDNGFYLKAIAVYKQMQRLDPSRVAITLRLAELNQKQGLTGNALAEYRVLVSACEQAGDRQGTLQYLQKMKDLEPENLNIRVKIIETHLKGSEIGKARFEFSESVELLEAKQDNARLLKLYEFFIPRFPDDPEMKLGKARVLNSKGESSLAITLLSDLLKETPNDPALLLQLAEAYRQALDYAREIATYRQLLQSKPQDLKLRAGLLRALIDGEEAPSALKELEEWKDIFIQAGQIKPLKGFYERLRSKLPDEERIITSLRAIYEITGEGDKFFDMICASSETEPAGDHEEAGEESAPEIERHPFSEVDVAEGAEEIPLEFLEGIGDSSETEEHPGRPATESELQDLEIEMELDLGFDFMETTEEEVGTSATETVSSTEEEIVFCLDDLEPPSPGSAGDGDFFDLRTAVLDDVRQGAASHVEETSIDPSQAKASKKRGIKTDVDVDDPDSHYNLGIAYKEMGLLEEAICEFEKAQRTPSFTVPSLSLKGMCLLELGAPARAEESFKAALGTPELDEDVRMGLLYELGLLYEGWSRPEEALENFRIAADIDPSFRHVGDKVQQLRRVLAGEDSRDEPRKRERISYV